MQEENEQSPIQNEEEPLGSQTRGFAPDALVTCESCLRANPPTRTGCLYCGAALPVTEASAVFIKPTLRPLETWEQGFSAIVLPDAGELPDQIFARMADLLRLGADDLRSIFASKAPLPLARCATKEDAELVKLRLNELGVRVVIIADPELDARAPVRVRTVELTDASLLLFPTGREEARAIPWQAISLIVVGRRMVRRLEVAERSVKKSGKEVVDSRELSSDAERLDLYSNQGESGWRIAADNFDFSCLLERKTPLASRNFQTLVETLRSRAELAEFNDSYTRLRRMISLVWQLDEHTESLGFQRPRSGRINTHVVTTTDNESQFTRYSKLLHYLKLQLPS